MPIDEFTERPDADDVLQLAGDAALDAIKGVLGEHDVDGYSVVITITQDRADGQMATILHLDQDVDGERERAQAAFELQLLHVLASARALGYRLQVFPMVAGQG